MKTLLSFAAVALLSIAATTADAQTVDELRQHEKVLDGMCRGGALDDDAQINAACCARALVGARINQLGWCYGQQGQISANMKWHRCTSRSQRYSIDYCTATGAAR